MKAAFVIFDGLTLLDFVGVYDPLGRLKTMQFSPDFEWRVCSPVPNVRDDRGLVVVPDEVGESLSGYDLVIVPGGHSTRRLQKDRQLVDWLATAATASIKATVCTGSLLIGAAGFLVGRPATTHHSALDELRQYTNEVRQERIVDSGDVVTAGGVTAAIDLGLHLVERISGTVVRQQIARQIEYPTELGNASPCQETQ